MYVLWVQVYDVYRPGSHVSRKRAVYPPVMYRLALCSGTPPTPQARDDSRHLMASDEAFAAG